MSLSTAAVLAAGAPPALAADVPKLAVTLTATPAVQEDPTKPIDLTAVVSAEGETIKDVVLEGFTVDPEGLAKIDGECTQDCALGDIEVGEDREIKATVSVPPDIKSEQTILVTVTVDSEQTEREFDAASVVFVPPKSSSPPSPPSPSPRPTPTPTPSPGQGKKPSDGKEDKGEDKKDDDGGSGGSGSSGSGGSSSSGSGYTPPSPNASFTPPPSSAPGVSLPSIAPPSPSLAPGPTSPTPESRLRNNKAPVAQDLTFERIASTQVAWLAALLAAFSLLLTQLRLGRRRALPGAAPAVAARRKGAHRRPRRGAFGK
ncbi:hypothetical protein [Actinomadura rubrobrunea]|uniref:hypothetical protein n=1 Tax=Actinomadura rubrobrunea TaxID=115335 RepID=UPI00082ED21C|nr:hypothetical protein [Actinomadura rubrobrunea]